MKFFIVAALLVAAVAGQTTMDILKFNKEKALLNKFDRPITSEYYLKKLGYPTDKVYNYNTFPYTYGDNVNVDVPTYFQDDVLERQQVLHLEEILEHPLFREYIQLPIFRQYWTYPAFQKYVTSVYFQKFWHIPTFKQYFVNPVLFYKYIYPIVNLFKTDITIPTTNYYGGDEYMTRGNDMIVNKNVFPFVADYERDLLKDNKYFVPTIYNQELKHKDDLIVKTLLAKIYSHLYNIPEELVKEHFFNRDSVMDKYAFDKYTYPVDTTFKTFDHTVFGDKFNYPVDTIYNKNFDSTVYGDKLVKDVLLKKMLLNKMIHGDKTYKTVIPEEFMLREKMMDKVNPLMKMMYGYNKLPVFNKFETIDTVDKMNLFDINKDLVKDDLINMNLKKELLLKDKILYNKIFNDKINQEIKFDQFETIPKVEFNTPMMGVRTFEKKMPETIIKA